MTVGSLGFRGVALAGFDISALDGTAFAAFQFTGPPNRDNPLYVISLTAETGTFVRTVGGLGTGESVRGLAVLTAGQQAVPEPGGLALAGTGLVALLGWGWRRRKPPTNSVGGCTSGAAAGRSEPSRTTSAPPRSSSGPWSWNGPPACICGNRSNSSKK